MTVQVNAVRRPYTFSEVPVVRLDGEPVVFDNEYAPASWRPAVVVPKVTGEARADLLMTAAPSGDVAACPATGPKPHEVTVSWGGVEYDRLELQPHSRVSGARSTTTFQVPDGYTIGR